MKGWQANWGTGIAIAIAVFLLGILALVAVSLREDVNLVHDQYYDRGQQYGTRLRAMERAQALRDPLTVVVDHGAILLTYPHTVSPGEISGHVTFYRPSKRAMDRTLAVAPDSAWAQAIPTDGLERGLWKIQVEWTMGGEAYYIEQPVMMRGS